MDIENFLASHTYSETTKERYTRILRELSEDQIKNWSASDLLRHVQKPQWGNMQQTVALYTIRKYIAWRFGQSHPTLTAKLKRTKPPMQRTLTIEKAIEILTYFNPNTVKGSRDLTLVCLALDTGLRASELCSLQVSKINLEERTLQAIIKGGQWGFAIFSEDTAAYITAWMQFREPIAKCDNLFINSKTGEALTRNGLGSITKKWSKDLGWRISPHDLRRSFATIATLFKAPTRLTQLGGRWSNIDMVEHYTKALQLEAFRPYLPIQNLKFKDTQQ